MKHENGQNYVKTLVGKIHTASERISTNFTSCNTIYISGFVWVNQLKLHNNQSKKKDIDKLFLVRRGKGLKWIPYIKLCKLKERDLVAWLWKTLRCKIFGFFSPLVPSKREKNILVLLSLYSFSGKCVYFSIFEW